MRLLSLLALLPLSLCAEVTFSMVKPDAISHAKEILAIYEKNGLKVVQAKEVHLTKEQAAEFYAVHKERPFYNDLTDYISSGPVYGMELEGDNAVAKVRELMGATNPEKAAPGTIRALYGSSIERNAVHGSDSPESAKTEIQFFFNGLQK